MDKDEAYVRSVWEKVDRCGAPWRPVRVFHSPGPAMDFEAWVEAAEFTRERLEHVRQLREEIECVKEQQAEWAGCVGQPELHYYACWTRILALLESELSKLTAGMKKETL